MLVTKNMRLPFEYGFLFYTLTKSARSLLADDGLRKLLRVLSPSVLNNQLIRLKYGDVVFNVVRQPNSEPATSLLHPSASLVASLSAHW